MYRLYNIFRPITKEEIERLFKIVDAMCMILSKDIFGNGFFIELDIKDIPYKKCLMTTNNILNENDIEINKEMTILYKNEVKIIEITKDRKACTGSSLNYNYTCIEIFDKDDIEDYFKIDNQIKENHKEKLEKEDWNKEIFILINQNENEFSFSLYNKIRPFWDEKLFEYTCSLSKEITLGSPIILIENNSIFGLNIGGRFGNINSEYIIEILNNIKKYFFQNKQ